MLIKDQKVVVKWNARNKQRLINLGYIFTSLKDEAKIDIKHLSHASDALVIIKCDYCDATFPKKYVQYMDDKNDSYVKKDACESCLPLKRTESSIERNKNNLLNQKINTQYLGVVYKLTDKFFELDDYGKMIIKEIQRFCEENGRFPKDKEISKKNGYIGRSQIFQHFKSNSFTIVYDYIIPLHDEEKPDIIKCIKCNTEKLFNKDNFSGAKNQKFGLKYICRICENDYTLRNRYKRRGIIFNEYEDIEPEIWLDYYIEGKIQQFPPFCISEINLIKIFKKFIIDYLGLTSKLEICDDENFNIEVLKKYELYYQYNKFDNKLTFLQKCFPEFNISPADLKRCGYTEESMLEIFDRWISENNLTITQLLGAGLTNKFSKKIEAMLSSQFNFSKYNGFIWYFNKKNFVHPITKEVITVHDFADKPNGYWDIRDNRMFQVRKYCESKCIKDSMGSNELLKKWVYQNFKQSDVAFMSYSNYYKSLYELLIDAYPEIKENNLLFEWEWHQYNKSDKQSLLQMMRDLVIYRLNDLVINLEEDIPKTINYTFMNYFYPKFNKQLTKGRYEDYHDWCSQAFPEFAETWTKENFGILIARDGAKCSSIQEKFIYEFIKYEMGFKDIKAIGLKRSGKYVYDLSDEHDDERYCPDFIMQSIILEGKKVELYKPLLIEYFGWFVEGHKHPIFIKYREKTVRKNNFYRNVESINYVDLYPSDLNNSCAGIRNKIKNAVLEIV